MSVLFPSFLVDLEIHRRLMLDIHFSDLHEEVKDLDQEIHIGLYNLSLSLHGLRKQDIYLNTIIVSFGFPCFF